MFRKRKITDEELAERLSLRMDENIAIKRNIHRQFIEMLTDMYVLSPNEFAKLKALIQMVPLGEEDNV